MTDSSELKFKGHYISIIEKTFSLANGHKFSREIVTHPGAVVILPIADASSVFMIHQFRHAIETDLLEFPAGTLEPGEDPLECAKRELAEEIGMKANKWIPLGILYPAPGFCNEKQYCYAALELSPYTLPGDDDELIQVEKVSIVDIYARVSSGKFCDGKSLALLMKAKSLGVLEI
jgi:ADP-ribose pyrophosphatase